MERVPASPPDIGDWAAICEVRSRWAQGLDTRDWTLLRAQLCDEVFVDYSGWSGQPGAMVAADDWVRARLGLFPGLWASQHNLTNPQIRIEGDRARGTTNVTAEHILDEDGERWFTLGGVYSDEYVRSDGSWLISSMTLTPSWYRGDRGVMDEGRRRAAILNGQD